MTVIPRPFCSLVPWSFSSSNIPNIKKKKKKKQYYNYMQWAWSSTSYYTSPFSVRLYHIVFQCSMLSAPFSFLISCANFLNEKALQIFLNLIFEVLLQHSPSYLALSSTFLIDSFLILNYFVLSWPAIPHITVHQMFLWNPHKFLFLPFSKK